MKIKKLIDPFNIINNTISFTTQENGSTKITKATYLHNAKLHLGGFFLKNLAIDYV